MVGAQRYLGDNLLHFPLFSQREKEQGGKKKKEKTTLKQNY